MATIDRLPSVSSSEVSSADNLPIYSSANGDARKLSLANFLTWLKTSFVRQDYTTTVATVANGFTQTVTDDGLNRWILLRPTGALATGTVVLPTYTNATDGQEILVTTTQAITAFTVNGNGATAVYGAPTVLAAEDFFKLRYNLLTTSWYAV